MISQFPDLAANVAETSSLSGIRGAVVGIEAAEYLNRIHEFNNPALSDPAGVLPEPLIPALGGVPFGLARIVQLHIQTWAKYNITPIFVFGGLDFGKPDPAARFADADATEKRIALGWTQYDNGNGNGAVEHFRASKAVKAQDIFRYLQQILSMFGVQFIVAPYSALAQLSYLAQVNTTDATYAASEVLLFDVPEVITSWDFNHESIVWVRKRSFISSLGNGGMTNDQFIDVCLLAGNDLLPTSLQPDQLPIRKNARLKSAMDVVLNTGRGSAHTALLNYLEDDNSEQNYIERYRLARMAIKYHVVIKKSGKAEPLNVEEIPRDVVEFMGSRLPDELYFYLSKGVIGPRVLNWRTTGRIIEVPPLDGGETLEYRMLVRDQLLGLKVSAIGVLASCLHFYHSRTPVELRCWFDRDDKSSVKTVNMKDEVDPNEVKALVGGWNVPLSVFGPEFNKHRGSNLFGICVQSLKDKDFAAQSITQRAAPLEAKDELLANAIWRMLHLRGYVNDDHTLTPWGEVLYAMVSNLPQEHQDNALIAVELARNNRLNSASSNRYKGVPEAAQPTIVNHITLISRIACLGTLSHQQIGYTGVLSRNMLVYVSMVEEVRKSLRDLLEVCVTSMLLLGDASRNRSDWTDLSMDLPFVLPMSCSLGIAVAYHLSECTKLTDPTSSGPMKALLADEQSKFVYAIDLPDSFRTAWTLWDGVFEGVKSTPSSFKDKAAFEKADEWLKQYRSMDS